MTTLMRYDPFSEALRLRDAMNQLFEQSFVRPVWGAGGVAARAALMDVYETENGYQVHVLLPGVKPDDVEVTVQQNTLNIKGQFQASTEQKQVNWLIQEIGSGSFERTITFPRPIDADKIETHFEHGVLTISIPFHEASKPRRISISGAQPRQITVEAGAH
jgi:HSP20 family protein